MKRGTMAILSSWTFTLNMVLLKSNRIVSLPVPAGKIGIDPASPPLLQFWMGALSENRIDQLLILDQKD